MYRPILFQATFPDNAIVGYNLKCIFHEEQNYYRKYGDLNQWLCAYQHSIQLNMSQYLIYVGCSFWHIILFSVCKKLCALNDMPTNDQSTLIKERSHFPSLHPTHSKEELRGSGNLRKIKPRIGALANLRFALRFGSSTVAWIPPFGLPESDLLLLTFAIQLRCLAHPSSGAFGQILSPPQRLLESNFQWAVLNVKKCSFIKILKIDREHFHREAPGCRQDLPERSRWGMSRRVDKTRRAKVRRSKSDSGSKPKACGIRADSRLV